MLERHPAKKKLTAAGLAVLALAGAFQAGRSIEHNPNKPTTPEVVANPGMTDILAAKINAKEKVTWVNGMITKPLHGSGSEQGVLLHVSNPLVVKKPGFVEMQKFDPSGWRYFIATQGVDGKADVTEVELTPDAIFYDDVSLTLPLMGEGSLIPRPLPSPAETGRYVPFKVEYVTTDLSPQQLEEQKVAALPVGVAMYDLGK